MEQDDDLRELPLVPENVYRKFRASDLEQMFLSSGGMETLWVMVEGQADLDFYPKMLNPEVQVYIAGKNKENEDGSISVSGGLVAVKDVVEKIRAVDVNRKIIGIVDRDNTDYGQTVYVEIPYIYRTDKRDLEMTLSSLPSAWNAITTLPDYVRVNVADWKEMIGRMGAYRVYEYWKYLDFRIELKLGKLYDSNTHAPFPQWKQRLHNQVEECYKLVNAVGSLPLDLYEQVECQFSIHSKDFREYCQGHESFRLLAMMMVTGNHSEKELRGLMIDNVSVNDIKSLNLYNSIGEEYRCA